MERFAISTCILYYYFTFLFVFLCDVQFWIFVRIVNIIVVILVQYEISLNSTDTHSSDRKVHVSVSGPSTRPSANLKWQGHAATCDFIPLEPGMHKVFNFRPIFCFTTCNLIINKCYHDNSSNTQKFWIDGALDQPMEDLVIPEVMSDLCISHA